MPDKNTDLQQWQIGKESTWGTAVATVRELSDIMSGELKQETVIAEHHGMGSRQVTQRDPTQVHGTAKTSFNLTYNHLAVLMDSLFGTATPSGSGPYTRTYTAPDRANQTRSFYTLLHGDSTDANSLFGALADKLKISAKPGGYVTCDVDWIGQRVGDDSLDSVSPDTGLVFVLPQHLDIQMGALGQSLTSLGCDAISLDMELATNTTVRPGLGQITGCDHNVGQLEFTITIKATADNSTIKTIYESLLGSSPTLVKRDLSVIFTESVNNSAQFDLPVTQKSDPALYTDEDGVATVEMEFGAYLDLTGTTSFSSSCDVTVINSEATLP